MTTFGETYRELVFPVLEECCRKQGFYLAIELIDYCEAHNVVSRLAYSRGAVHLGVYGQENLDKWIAENILRYADSFADSARESVERAERIDKQARKHMAQWLLKMGTTEMDQ